MKSLAQFIIESNLDNSKSLIEQGYLLSKIHIHGWDSWSMFDLDKYDKELENKDVTHPQLGWWTEISVGKGQHIPGNMSATFDSKTDKKWDRIHYGEVAPVVYALLYVPNALEELKNSCSKKNVNTESKVRGKSITFIFTSSNDWAKITFKK
ncbi:MAG: hypothetical protein J1F35_08110 [Erysipelotrichales bacterium]|nr:hypothetical protein [Erysipelotrichales bacterium]